MRAMPVSNGKSLSERDAVPSQPIGTYSEQKRRRAQRQRHDEEVRDDRRTLEAFDVGEPWRGPQALQRPGGAVELADSGARRQKRKSR